MRSLILSLVVVSAMTAGCGHRRTTTTQPPATETLVASVLPGEILNADGGKGVGVFVEYVVGGHWTVWWACDTTVSGLPCNWDIAIDGTNITNLQTGGFSASDVATASGTSIDISADTTTEVEGITFDAPAGTRITIDAMVSGVRDGKYFFWVASDPAAPKVCAGTGLKCSVRGGYTGPISNPLVFEPAAP